MTTVISMCMDAVLTVYLLTYEFCLEHSFGVLKVFEPL